MEDSEFTGRSAAPPARKKQKAKSIHKRWVNFRSGAKALLTDFIIVLQIAMLALIYAYLALRFRIFYYVSLGLTALTGLYVFISERDSQTRASWLLLFLVSFGSGYIVYILADKRVCYAFDKARYNKIAERAAAFEGDFCIDGCSQAVKNDCEYAKNSGYKPYTGTDLKYYSDAALLFEEMLKDIEKAEKYVFLEYFIVSEGELLKRLAETLSKKASEGVEIKFLYDDVGSQGVFKSSTKKTLTAAGVNLKAFAKLATIFSFGLDYRDHRKIVVVDGKRGYVGGCNIADDCVNHGIKNGGKWKDAGLKMEGAAADGLGLIFLKQWELATREKADFGKYLGQYEKTDNTSVVLPYAGGPEIDEPLCRGIYANAVSGAREKLYVMTPYLIPDGEMMNSFKTKARSGVDVRIALPAVPDYFYLYAVTRSNAERLQKQGVKIYFVDNTFLHSKVMLTENCAIVGSTNLDMRSFYIEFDNGVYTDDKEILRAAESDFEEIFKSNPEAPEIKRNFFSRFITAILRIVSPLM